MTLAMATKATAAPVSRFADQEIAEPDCVQAAVLKGEFGRQADIVARYLAGCEPLNAYLRRRGVARQKALKVLRAALPGAVVIGKKDFIEIRWLAPCEHVIAAARHPRDLQDCIICNVLLAWRKPSARNAEVWAGWLTEIPDHAAARLIERAPNVDLRVCLFEAAAAFAAADAQAVLGKFNAGISIYLPAGPGAFGVEIIPGKIEKTGRDMLYARAGTWISDGALEPYQRRRLLTAAPSPKRNVATLLLKMAQAGD